MPSGNDSVIDAAARLMATNPGADKRVLAMHRRRSDGYCTGCWTRPTKWPCGVASVALRVGEIGKHGGGR